MKKDIKPGKFLFLEPFFGGSHRDFAEGLAENTTHQMDLMTMSARFWRWRMGGAALHFARRLPDMESYDGVIVSGLVNLCDLIALAPKPFPPSLVYFHENQLTYPVSEGETRDVQLGWTNVTTALAADRVIFNSRTHEEQFMESLPDLIRIMPDYRPGWITEAIRRKSSVLYPGCRFPLEKAPLLTWEKDAIPLIIWNHRWEYDKNPGSFFRALDKLLENGIKFRLALLGQQFRSVPETFKTAQKRYAEQIVRCGFVESREDYIEWLKKGAIVVSTAIQENFGISVVEAVRFGCIPILPHRLSYPELIPTEYHGNCLYSGHEGLVEKLTEILKEPDKFRDLRKRLSDSMLRFSWERQICGYDKALTELAECRR